jgi:hypothetical protein
MNWVPDVRSTLALIVVASSLTLVFVMLFVDIKDNKLIDMAVGIILSGGFTTIVNFFFGSSAGSKDKDDIIGKVALGPPPTPSQQPPPSNETPKPIDHPP